MVDKDKIKMEIEKLRRKMVEASQDYSLSDEEVIEISQRLDKYIVEYTKDDTS